MRYLLMFLFLVPLSTFSQVREVQETVILNGQDALELNFDFADDISIETWDRDEVQVQVKVQIAAGEYNHIFSLHSQKTGKTLTISMDKEMWSKIPREYMKENNGIRSELNYRVMLPRYMTVKAYTISGNYNITYFNKPLEIKTISGEVDLRIAEDTDMEFHAKTISGDIFTDLEVSFPYGKDGLNQLVGTDINGRLNEGGSKSRFESISGAIYLRKL